jgi:hypothetical protein
MDVGKAAKGLTLCGMTSPLFVYIFGNNYQQREGWDHNFYIRNLLTLLVSYLINSNLAVQHLLSCLYVITFRNTIKQTRM